ncbi:MAG TPA: type II and III secretion system protein family protein [Stellaceae bacterium]|jgi:pilus assembly protein CpaC|nr:type II and III secretion system protein family protein [Stellaceae bacterium]
MNRMGQHGIDRPAAAWLAVLSAVLLTVAAVPARGDSDVAAARSQIAAAAADNDEIGLPNPTTVRGAVTLEVSQGKLIVLPAPAKNVFIADPVIADVQVANADHVFVFGRKAGRTSLYALGVDGILLRAVNIEVYNPTGRAQQLTTATPGSSDIHVGNTANGLVLEGTAASPAAAALAQRSATENAPDKAAIDDRVKVRGSAQVTLRVRIAEVSRTITKQLGFNWNALMQAGNFQYGLYTGRTLFSAATTTGGGNLFNPAPPLQSAAQPGSLIGGFNTAGGSLNAVIDALAEEGLVTILAEPTLTAISGETASFLAGGEFPIPISQALGVTTIEFKSYGVSLNFLPTVMAPNHISLRVRPEVSQITTQGAITVSGLQIPALTVRRADTTIELGSGQSFAIAGLIQDNTTNDIQRFPGLGDLPVLGALFRSTAFQRQESELLIVVTPYIVRPIDDPKSIRYPTDAWKPATDIERVFYGLIAAPNPHAVPGNPLPENAAVPHLLGAAGFEVE